MPQKISTLEFRQEAVRLMELGQSVSEAWNSGTDVGELRDGAAGR